MMAAVEPLLAEAHRYLAVGDTASLARTLMTFDKEIVRNDLSEDPIVARGWPLHLALWRSQGRPESVVQAGSHWARRARRKKWYAAQSAVLSLMGRAALDLSDFTRGAVWFEEGFAAAERADDDSLRANALLGTAIAWELQGEPTRFRREAERALPYAERGADRLVLAGVLNALGRARLAASEDDAEGMLKAAEEVLAHENAHVALVKCLLDHLALPRARGDTHAASRILDRAESLLRLVEDEAIHGRVVLERGELLRSMGKTTAAMESYRDTLRRVPSGHPVARLATLNLALARVFDGQIEPVRRALPELVAATQGHSLFQGIVNLIALAVGPATRSVTEDDLWLQHGTPARLALRDAGHEPDVERLALVVAGRMVRDADPIQAGRAALIAGISSDIPKSLTRALRGSRAAMPIGPFLALQRLGAGGMGEVWLGRHVDTHHPAAIKVVSPDTANDTTAMASFENELKAIATLDHANIVRLLDHGRAGRAAAWTSGGRIKPDSPFLALEYVRGGTISAWMGKMTWPQVRRVLADLLRALAHAHARRVLHLDLKPDNVLLNEPGDPLGGVRLTDFGLALLRGQTRDGIAGTLTFMAPEQLAGDRLGTHTDLYALGCLGWGMLLDAAPYQAPDQAAMRALHAAGPPASVQWPADVPDGVGDWLLRLIAIEPRRRFQRASDALKALKALDADLPTSEPANSAANSLVTDSGLGLIHARRPPLVGHRTEREALWKHFLGCRDRRRPSAVELHGPPGSGTKALANWLAVRAHEAGIAEVIRHDPKKGLAALIEGHPPVSPGSMAVRWLSQLDRDRNGRVALIIASAGDPTFPPVLDILLREADGPLFFVVTSPPGVLKRNRFVQRLEPKPVSDDDVRTTIRSFLQLESGLEDRLVRWSEGNAGLAVSKLQELTRAGELRPSREGWGSPQLSHFWVPSRIRLALEPALRDAADTPTRWDALQLAAAMGTRVDPHLWESLSEEAPVLQELLLDARILVEEPDGLRWAHPAARHLVAEERTTRLAHSRIADHLTEQSGSPERIAYHRLAAHQYADAHRPLLDAIEQRLSDEDDVRARELYDQWCSVLDRLAVSANDPRRLAGRRFASHFKTGCER